MVDSAAPKNMNATLFKALFLFLFALVLFVWLFSKFLKRKILAYLLELIGAGFLAVVGVVHIFEAEKWFEFMHWGSPHSIGHYLDFFSAIASVGFLLIGFILSFKRKQGEPQL